MGRDVGHQLGNWTGGGNGEAVDSCNSHFARNECLSVFSPTALQVHYDYLMTCYLKEGLFPLFKLQITVSEVSLRAVIHCSMVTRQTCLIALSLIKCPYPQNSLNVRVWFSVANDKTKELFHTVIVPLIRFVCIFHSLFHRTRLVGGTAALG